MASGARLASLLLSVALGAVLFCVGTAASALAGWLAGVGSLAGFGVGVGATTCATVVGALIDSRGGDGWMAGARANWLRSIMAGDNGAAGGDTGDGSACAIWIRMAPTVIAGACGWGMGFGAITTGACSGTCCITMGEGCAGNGNGCSGGTSGAAGGCGAGVTLIGATVFGMSTCMAMAGKLSGVGGVDTFGRASEVGDRIGRLPSTCGGLTGSG